MPYVTPTERIDPDRIVEQVDVLNFTDGQLNYLITRIVARAYNLCKPRYSNIQRAVGLIICVVFELYRRVAGKYEDKKMAENGDVPEYENLN